MKTPEFYAFSAVSIVNAAPVVLSQCQIYIETPGRNTRYTLARWGLMDFFSETVYAEISTEWKWNRPRNLRAPSDFDSTIRAFWYRLSFVGGAVGIRADARGLSSRGLVSTGQRNHFQTV